MANRGIVHYDEPTTVSARGPLVSASYTTHLIDVILVMLNERDSINKILANPVTNDGSGSTTSFNQLQGIDDKSKEVELNAAKGEIYKGNFVYASPINVIIKYTNELLSTIGKSSYTYSTVECAYPNPGITIIKHNETDTVPDQPLLDPVTGEYVLDTNGNKIMVAGYHNPVPVLDSNGNPTYYTKTGQQIYQEGPNVNADVTEVVTLCSNTAISCPNRIGRFGWNDARMAGTANEVVYLCSNTKRLQIVYNQTSVGGTVNNVFTDQLIKASDFNAIAQNLNQISLALDTYQTWWGGNGTCQRSCQVACQKPCQLSCQNCFSGTCHDQNCGGWS